MNSTVILDRIALYNFADAVTAMLHIMSTKDVVSQNAF
jgi:hypothetical protein